MSETLSHANTTTTTTTTAHSFIPKCTAKWFWSPSRNTFTPYDVNKNCLIESHYQKVLANSSISPIVSISLGNFAYTIDVRKFTQKNAQSRKTRRIRRVLVKWFIAGVEVSDPHTLKALADAHQDTSIATAVVEYNAHKYDFYIDEMVMYPQVDHHEHTNNDSSQNATLLPDLDVEREEIILPDDQPERVTVLKMTEQMMDSPQDTLPHDASPQQLKAVLKDITAYVALNKHQCEQLTDDCPICLYSMNTGEHTVVQICGRDHFHLECLMQCFDKHNCFLRCPMCFKTYGIRRGTMPRGTMTIQVCPDVRCSGYNCGTIVIQYRFPNGVQRKEHPNPGENYHGTSRTAYLPDNSEGRYILKMFKIAWERRLLFTVGRSVTTGEDNSVIWNGVHHKTSTHGGFSNFAFPDDTYFARVQGELNDKGVSLQKDIVYDTSTRMDTVEDDDEEH